MRLADGYDEIRIILKVSVPLAGIRVLRPPLNQQAVKDLITAVSVPLAGIRVLRQKRGENPLLSRCVSVPLAGIRVLRPRGRSSLTTVSLSFSPVSRD